MAGIGGWLLVLSLLTPAFEGGPRVPLIWLVMPLPAWGGLIFGFACLSSGLKAILDRDKVRFYWAAGWGALSLICLIIFANQQSKTFELLKGSIELSWPGLAAVVGLGAAAFGIMALLGSRGKAAARGLALVCGTIVFGLPFAWLLITSFKEDRDMVGAQGLVWIPRVQRTVPYHDPEKPLLEGIYKGSWVQAELAGRTSDGGYFVEVQRPSSLRGVSFEAPESQFKEVPRAAPVVKGDGFLGFVARELGDGSRLVEFIEPADKKGRQQTFLASELEPVRDIGLRTQNYSEALEAMPPETRHGLVYLRNTLLTAILSVIGALLSSSLVAFGFARLKFPGRDLIFKLLLSTMMLPAAVTLLPQFLLFRSLGWVDTLLPLWAPAFFASAFNVFLLRQFFMQIPNELEDAAKIDGAGVLQTFWRVMLPQIGPALAVVAIWTFIGAWNNFMGPLIYINSPENMPLSYALQLFQTERGGSPGLMMAFATLTIIPVLLLFFFSQKYFVEGASLSGLGGR